MKTATHYSPIISFSRGEEVIYEGQTYIVSPPIGIFAVCGISPFDVRFWTKKNEKQLSELDLRMKAAHRLYCRIKKDYQLLETLLQKEQSDEDYYKVNAEEILTRLLN